jgi:peptidyl-prolyl cis-trans isomerase C
MRQIASIALLCLATNLACAAADPVATVNGVSISRATFERALAEDGVRSGDGAGPRIAVRDRLIAEELIWQKAKLAGYADGTERHAAITRFVAQSAVTRTFEENELRARYAQIVASLGPREYRLSLIQTADRAALATAQQALRRGEEFAQVARAHSLAPSARRGGELDWVSFRLPAREGHTNGVPIGIARAIAAMKPGEVSAAIDLGDAWALVRFDAERATVVPRYDEIKPDLQRALAAKALEDGTRDLVVTLFKGARITVHE